MRIVQRRTNKDCQVPNLLQTKRACPGNNRSGWGLALSGGGIRGGAHIGAITALREAGMIPSALAGTSAGGIVTGLYAAGLTDKEMRQVALEIANTPGILDYDILGLIKAAAGLFMGNKTGMTGFIKGDKLYHAFCKATHGRLMTQSICPALITSVDICTGQRVSFSSISCPGWLANASLAQGMRATLAIPAIFKPYSMNNMELVDGGVLDPLPVLLTEQLGVGRVLGIDVNAQSGKECADDILEIANQSLSIMMDELQADDRKAATYVLPAALEGVGTLELSALEATIDYGYEIMRAALPAVREALYAGIDHL